VANNKRMVPIFYRPVADEAIPEALGRFQRIDFGDNDNFDLKFATLIAALDTDLAWVQIHTVGPASCASVCASCLCLQVSNPAQTRVL